jgi:hypothetical protein
LTVLYFLQPDPDTGARPWNCATCYPKSGPALRALLHCGFMPRSEWSASREHLPPSFGGEPYTLDVCPGWLVRQPAVVEGAEAAAALEAGVLDRFDPLGLRVVYQAAMAGRRGANLYQIARTKPKGGR